MEPENRRHIIAFTNFGSTLRILEQILSDPGQDFLEHLKIFTKYFTVTTPSDCSLTQFVSINDCSIFLTIMQFSSAICETVV